MRFLSAITTLLLIACPWLHGAESAGAWEFWGNCTHLADRYYDGDSFQVKSGRKAYVIRLYGADTPETDTGYGQRIDEQAAYFGIKPSDVLLGGRAAKAFTAKFLSEPFRVITRHKVAPGASRSERIYALVERDGVSLDVALVQAGLARATSETADYPDTTAGQQHFQQLRAFEQKAANERKGLWAKSGRTDLRPSLAEQLKPRLFKPESAPELRRINLNTASAIEIEALPGIGPKTAEQIIRNRPLKDIDALDALPGFGPKKIEALRPLISF